MQRTVTVLLVIMTLFFSCVDGDEPVEAAPGIPASIMAVFAHPDDETTVASVLAKYASLTDVYLVIATDGRYGITDHAGIPAGDSLVAIRKEELKCSCRELGIHPPIQFAGHDQFRLQEGVGGISGEIRTLRNRLHEVIDSLKPEVILTFGPEAVSGHPDHRLTSDVLEEVLAKQNYPWKPSLYYVGFSKEQTETIGEFRYKYISEDQYRTVVPYTQADEEKFFASLRCHASQFSPAQIEYYIKQLRANSDNRTFFRRILVDEERRQSF